jgi:hypothetical protein
MCGGASKNLYATGNMEFVRRLERKTALRDSLLSETDRPDVV